MRKQTIRIYLLFLLASLAMLTHFSHQGEFRRLRTATKGSALWNPQAFKKA